MIAETFENEGEEHDPLQITGARYRGQVQAEGTSYYQVPVIPGKMYLIKATQEEVNHGIRLCRAFRVAFWSTPQLCLSSA